MDFHHAMVFSEDQRRRIISDMRHLKVHSAQTRHVYLAGQISQLLARLRAWRPGIRVTRPIVVR